MSTFVQNYRLTETDLTKNFYLGITGIEFTGIGYTGIWTTGVGITGLPSAPPYPVNPYWVRYEIDYIEPVDQYPIRIGPLNRIPLTTFNTTYYANFIVGERWATGDYQIIWKSYMTGETGIPLLQSTDTFGVTGAGIYEVHGITGPVIWYGDIYSETGIMGETGTGETGI